MEILLSMSIALLTGLLKLRQVQESADFLISIMPVLYVPICVRILEYWGVISQNAAAIISLTVISTFLVFAVAGLLTQALMKRGGKSHD